MGARIPSKLVMRVRFSSPAPQRSSSQRPDDFHVRQRSVHHSVIMGGRVMALSSFADIDDRKATTSNLRDALVARIDLAGFQHQRQLLLGATPKSVNYQLS